MNTTRTTTDTTENTTNLGRAQDSTYVMPTVIMKDSTNATIIASDTRNATALSDIIRPVEVILKESPDMLLKDTLCLELTPTTTVRQRWTNALRTEDVEE